MQINCKHVTLYLCFGFSPYNAWLNLSLSLFSATLHKNPKGKIFMTIRSALVNTISPGMPLTPTRFRIQEPLLVLRKTWRGRQDAFIFRPMSAEILNRIRTCALASLGVFFPLMDTSFGEVLDPPVCSPCWAPQQCHLLNYQFQWQPLSCSAIHLQSCSHDCGCISPWMCPALKWNIDLYQYVYLTPNTSSEETVFADIIQ